MGDSTDPKAALRRELRRRRRAVADPAAGSDAIVDRLVGLGAFEGADVVLLYDAVPGEPDLERLARWCGDRGIRVVEPTPDPTADDPIPPEDVDVVVVPGVAFTRDGHRLGQGGGWYDRFLARCRPDVVTIGVCFDEQIVDAVPVEPHDLPVGRVVTPSTTWSG